LTLLLTLVIASRSRDANKANEAVTKPPEKRRQYNAQTPGIYRFWQGRIKRGGAIWAVAQRHPQLRGHHKKTVKNYYLRKHKILFETDNLE